MEVSDRSKLLVTMHHWDISSIYHDSEPRNHLDNLSRNKSIEKYTSSFTKANRGSGRKRPYPISVYRCALICDIAIFRVYQISQFKIIRFSLIKCLLYSVSTSNAYKMLFPYLSFHHVMA